MSTAGVFYLAPLVPHDEDPGRLASLESVQPLFYLPLLQECDPSADRLLDGLKFRPSPKRRVNDSEKVASVKGKEKENVDVDVDEPDGSADPDHAFWLSASETAPGPSKGRVFQALMTWDAGRPPASDFQPGHMLSEGSMFTFDALIGGSHPEVHLPKPAKTNQRQTRKPREVLELLIRATLGSVTTGGITWSKRENKFQWAKAGGRLEGLALDTSTAAITGYLDIATCLRRLEILVDSLASKPMTPTHHSLIHALSTYLTYIKQNLTDAINASTKDDAPAFLKWSSHLREMGELLEVLCDVIQWPLSTTKPDPLPSRASVILDRLYALLLARLSTRSPGLTEDTTTIALAYILSRSSQPLLDLLHQWIGLAVSSPADEDVDTDSQPWSDLGITRHAVNRGSASERWEYTFSPSKMPRFVPRTDRRVLFEAGRSLRLLRDASAGQHPLCGGSWDLCGEWGWGTDAGSTDHLKSHARRAQREIEHWRRSNKGLPKSLSTSSSFPQLRQPRKSRKKLPLEFSEDRLPSRDPRYPIEQTGGSEGASTSAEADSPTNELDPIWRLANQQPGTHFATAKQSLWSPTPLAELEGFINHHSALERPLLPDSAPSLPQHISSSLLAPLLVHADLVSTALVWHYLDDLAFLDHLDVLCAHWLGGDVGYLERVNAALFGKDAAGAGEALALGKRARTRARLGLGNDNVDNERAEEQREWGIGLGIGLSERTKWPPGGAELTYALRSAMVDEERGVAVNEVWENIEDKVSYAIRELPEDQRDGRRARWLNPQAIEALDFLYLAYSPPPAIAVLLPQTLMEKYQSIHNLLLRLGRVETVLQSLFVDCHHRHGIFDQPLKTGVDAHPSRPSSRGQRNETTARQPRGIFPAGSRHETRLWHLRYRMSHFITCFSRYTLDIAVGANWAVLRRRLGKLQRSARTRTGDATTSRPSTPATDGGRTDDYFDLEELGFDDAPDPDDGEADQSAGTTHGEIRKLHSIHSLVLYHQLIMDRILRSCLLSPSAGYQVAFKVLMTLFGLVLDFGKTVKEVEKGLVGWEDGAERVDAYWREWIEKETAFLHAVDRLSMRTTSDKVPEAAEGGGDQAETNRDLELLLNGERDGSDEGGREGLVLGRQGADLQELVLRIRVQTGPVINTGRAEKTGDQV